MPSFAPIATPTTSVLILGSMPSQRSLQNCRYYDHPQNSFWWIMSKLLDFSESLNYEVKCRHLKLSNYGIWDVLYDCKRPGSLDSDIERNSEQVNDFDKFLKEHKDVKLIAFNGAAAKNIFMRHWSELLRTRKDIDYVQLPSTSPAHAKINRSEKLQQWRASLRLSNS